MKNELKLYTLLCLILLLGSCTKDPYFEAFENELGPENSKELTQLVSLFETDFLQKKYPKQPIHKAYEQLLKEYIMGEKVAFQDYQVSIYEVFKTAKLYREIHSFPDSVWIERDTSKMKLNSPWVLVKAFNSMNEEERITEHSFAPDMIEQYTVEELLEMERNRPRFNDLGAYVQALDHVKVRDAFLTQYVEVKQAAGYLDANLVFLWMQLHQVDYNDPIIRRIFVLELLH